MTGRCRLRSGTELGATSTSGASEVPGFRARPEGCVHPRGCAARSAAQIMEGIADIAGPTLAAALVEQGITEIGHLARTEPRALMPLCVTGDGITEQAIVEAVGRAILHEQAHGKRFASGDSAGRRQPKRQRTSPEGLAAREAAAVPPRAPSAAAAAVPPRHRQQLTPRKRLAWWNHAEERAQQKRASAEAARAPAQAEAEREKAKREKRERAAAEEGAQLVAMGFTEAQVITRSTCLDRSLSPSVLRAGHGGVAAHQGQFRPDAAPAAHASPQGPLRGPRAAARGGGGGEGRLRGVPAADLAGRRQAALKVPAGQEDPVRPFPTRLLR